VPASKRKTRKKPAAGKKAPDAKKKTTRKKAAPKAKETRAAVPVRAAPAEGSLEARLLAPLEEMERMLDAFRRRDWLRSMSLDWPRFPAFPEARFPSIDVIDRDKEIEINAEVPGIERDDLNVTVTDRTLTIRGESRHEEESEEGEHHRREIRRGSFSRTLTLPHDVDGKKATAKYKDGRLELRLPKLRKSRKHQVEVD
jgi:HSP20 family protein